MAITAGALSKVSVGSTSDSLLSAAATGGTTPYSYQWYRSTTTGFSAGAANTAALIAGATALSLNESTLIPGTQYYYQVVIIDSAATALSATAAQLSVLTTQPVLSQNAFGESPFLGMLDEAYNYNSKPVQIDSSQGATPCYPGQAVKIVNSAGGIPKVIACAANSDNVFGFINYNQKDITYPAGSVCEISQAGNVMYLYAIGTIPRGDQVTLDLSTVGGVADKTTSNNIVGWALDQGTVGTLIRVELRCPSFTTA